MERCTNFVQSMQKWIQEEKLGLGYLNNFIQTSNNEKVYI